jgi:hypothetical protein
MSAMRYSSPTLNTNDQIQENEIFEGATNPFIYQHYFDLEVRCNYKFFDYPFDQQECQVIVSAAQLKTYLNVKETIFSVNPKERLTQKLIIQQFFSIFYTLKGSFGLNKIFMLKNFKFQM